MQKLLKSITIFQCYDYKCTATFLWFTVYNLSKDKYYSCVWVADVIPLLHTGHI